MDTDQGEMCKSLIQWFQTLNLKAPHSNPEELSDGVALAQALNLFAPESFTGLLFSIEISKFDTIHYDFRCLAFQNQIRLYYQQLEAENE